MKEVTDPNILSQLDAEEPAGKEVTDPAIISQLDAGTPTGKPVTDPNILSQLEAPSPELSEPNRLRAKYGFPPIEDVPAAIPEPGYDVLGGVADIGKLLYDIPIQTKGAIARLAEEEDPLATIDWRDRWVEEAGARTEKRIEELGEKGEEKVLPWVTRGDIAETSGSTGFSLASMAAGAAGAGAGFISPVPGGAAIGMLGASGAAAYKMDKTAFTADLFAATENALGRKMTPVERKELLEKTADARESHALWEAGPEAIGNLLSIVGVGQIFKAAGGKNVIKKIVKGLAGIYGGELTTETVTQIGQQRAEVAAGLSDEEARSFLSLEDIATSFKEIAPSVTVLSSLMAGGGAVAGGVSRQLKKKKEEAIPSPAPIEGQDTVDAAITEDIRKPTTDELVEEAYQRQQAARPAEAIPEKETDIQTLLREIKEAKAEEAAPGKRAKVQELVEEAHIKQQAIPTEAIDSQETVDEQIREDITREPTEEEGLEEIGPVEVFRVDNASGAKRDHFTFVGPNARAVAEREAAKLATAEGQPQKVYAVPPEEVFDKGGVKVGEWAPGADVYENKEKLDTAKFEAVTDAIQPMSDERIRSLNRLRAIKQSPEQAEAAAQRLGVDSSEIVTAAENIEKNGMPTNDIERALVNLAWADELTEQAQVEAPAPIEEAPIQAALPFAPEAEAVTPVAPEIEEIERPAGVFDDLFAEAKKPKAPKKVKAEIAAIPTKKPVKAEIVGEVYAGEKDGYKLYVDEAAGKRIIEHPSGSRLVETTKDGKKTVEVIGSADDFGKRTTVQELDDARELGVSLEARRPEADTGISKPTRDSSPADTKLFGDISNAEAIRVQGFKSLDRERQHMVVSSMVSALHEKKILDFIIETVPINVMNSLIGKKFSAKGLLDNPAMLTDRLAIPSNKAIPMPVIRFIDSLASSLKGGLTRLGAKKSSLIFPVTPSGAIVDTTISADQDPARPVTRLARLGAEELDLPRPDTTIPSTEAISTGRTHKDSQIHTSVINEQVVNVDINPTEAQKQAGNYLKGTLNIQGLNITIENPKGSERTGKEDGDTWTSKMHVDYGYIKESEGADGEHVDVYIGPNPESETAYAVHQIEPETGKYDEDKVMIGFDSQEEAEAAYRKQYDQGKKDKPNRIGAVTSIAIESLKEKIKADEVIGEEAIKQIEFKPEVVKEEVAAPTKEKVPAPPSLPLTQEGDILTKSGNPFKTRSAAITGIVANKKQDQGYVPIEVEGGWVARSEKVAPKLKIESIKAEHDGEPVTKTETKDILDDAKEEAKDEGITPAGQKTFLLSEIDDGLKEAPSESELEGVAPRDYGRVKIEVPGDGTFNIINTKEALTEFKSLVKKNFPGKEAAKKVAKRFVPPKPTAGKAKALKDVRQGIYEGKPYHTDGHVILLTKPALKPKQIDDSRWEDRPTIDASIIKDLIPKKGDKVTDIEFVAYEAGESQSISNLPIPDLREDKRFTGAPKARLISEKGEVYIGQDYYNYVLRHFPDATFHTTDEVSPVLVKDGKKTVGIVMPIRIEAAEVGVKEVRIPKEVPEAVMFSRAEADNIIQDKTETQVQINNQWFHKRMVEEQGYNFDDLKIGEETAFAQIEKKPPIITEASKVVPAELDTSEYSKIFKDSDSVQDHNAKVEIHETLMTGGLMTVDTLMNLRDLSENLEYDLERVGDKRYISEIIAEHEGEEIKDEIPTPPEDVFEAAKLSKGITDDIMEAGYVLPDGTLLDFSGKRDGGPAGERAEDHRQLGFDIIGDFSQFYSGEMIAFQKAGAARIDANSGMIDLEILPTTAQLSTIREVLEIKGEGYIDLQDGTRTTHLDIQNPSRAAGLIKRFYAGEDVGGKPVFKKKDFLGEGLPVEKIKEVPLKADIEAAVDIITTKWKNRDITTVSRMNQLPSHLHDAVIAAKGKKDVEGIFDPETGRVYLIAENIDSLERAKTVLFHESLGHFGIRGLLGKDITPVLNQVYIKYRAEAQKIATKYKFDLSKEQGRRQAAEEVLANIAQTNSDPGIIKKAIAAIRNWLRKMGFDIELSDSDIRSMMAQAADFTREGKKPLSMTGMVAYAKRAPAPIFFSKLQETIADKMPSKAPVDTVRGIIRDVKAEEVKWSGIEDYLVDKKTIKKDELLAFLQANEIQITEVSKGDVTINMVWDGNELTIPDEGITPYYIEQDPSSDLWDVYSVDEGGVVATETTEGRAKASAEDLARTETGLFEDEIGKTKYSQYTLPGGENYKEMLLTLPSAVQTKDDIAQSIFRLNYDQLFPGQKADVDAKIPAPLPGFETSHWDEPNVFAHIRFNERTDAEGNKVLFLEEVQSDWALEARKKGIAGEVPQELKDNWTEATEAFEAARNELYKKYDISPTSTMPWPTLLQKATEAETKPLLELRAERDKFGREVDTFLQGVPAAPFLTGNKWTELALKRMLRYASENGFDKVAWISGQQTADRYDLSKVLDKILYSQNEDGTYNILGLEKGQEIASIAHKNLSDSDLERFVGKDVATKIIKDEGTKAGEQIFRQDASELSGEDLKVGGEWAFTLYDKVIPNFLKKYGKKWGAKVGESEIPIDRDKALLTFDERERMEGEDITPSMTQQSIDITPEMKEAVLEGRQPMFARKEVEPAFRRDYTTAQQEALGKIAPEIKKETVAEKLADLKENLGIKIKQSVVDQYASLKELTKHGYMLARMSNTASGKLEAIFRHGKLRMLKDGAITVDTTGKGLANILAPLGGELNDFFAWIAGNRAEGLAKEDRERLFDKTDIEALKALNQGKMEDGKARPIVYAQVHKEFKDFQKSVLDVTEQSGLINKEERAIWEQNFYIPFYRVLEEQADTQGPKTLESLTGQTAIKRLKGADIKLNDLLSNVLMNWNHLIGASLKNNAAKVSLDAAVDMNVATQIKESEKTANSVFVRENGRKVWYDVSEPLILESLTSLNWDGFNSRALKAMRKFKRAFTIGVTASPEFRIANLLRDTIQSVAVGKMNYNVFDNVFGAGWKGTKRESITEARMMAGGGMMHFGHEYGADPDAARLMIEKGIKDDYILNNPKAFKGAKQALNTFWDTWREFGSRLENVNRAALYEKRVKEVGELKANFEARDLMDFTNHGAAPAVRLLIQVVPFLNARMQGLYKLGGAAFDKDQQRQLAAVTSMVALASMALFLTFKDDDDFKEREEWDRDTYWWFKIPGSDKAFRLPKPFEVGAIGTLAERMLEQIVDDEAHGELFAERLGHMIVQTFAFSVVPQMLQPTLDIYSNINPFTDRPIESMGMERLSKTERKKAWTSETTIAISKGMDAVLWDKVVLSPVQIEYMVKGYLGWIGAMTLGTIDNIFMEPLTGAPTEPTRRIDDYPAVGRFVRSNPARNTKYATLFYEQLQEMNTAYSDVQNYRKLREFNKAKESRQKNVEKLRWRTYFNKQQKRLSGITGRMKLIQLNKVMSATQKRAEIDLLQREKNRILKIAVERRDI